MDKNHTYLLSYPRSASHWFRYCFVQITKRENVYLGWRYPIGRITDRSVEKELARMAKMYPWPDHESFMKSEYTFQGFRLVAQDPEDRITLGSVLSPQLASLPPQPNSVWETSAWPDKYLVIPDDDRVVELDDNIVKKYPSFYNPKKRLPKYLSLSNFSMDPSGIVWLTEHWAQDPLCLHLSPLSNYHEPDHLMYKDRVVKTKCVPESTGVQDIKLFCIVRDYKEAVISQCKTDPSADFFEEVEKYMSILETYDKFPNEKRMMHYEDLVVDPFETLNENIVNFSGEGLGLSKEDMKKNLELLMEDYSGHQNHSIVNYRLGAGHATSEGKTIDYHQKDVSSESLRKFDKYVSKNYKYFQEKYLQRYLGE